MWHLVKSELLRFRGPAMAFAAAHLLVLGGLGVSGELFAAGEAKIVLGLAAYSLAGLILGLYQFGTLKRSDDWTFLLHRPLPPGKIFLSLSGAAALLVFAVFFLPLAAVTFLADHVTSSWVDLRQYLTAPFVFGTILCFYLVGCFIMLSASRAAILLLILPSFFLTGDAVGKWIFLPQVIVLAWLAQLAYAAFKPNLSTQLRHPIAVALAAIPVQYVVFWPLTLAVVLVYSSIVAFQEHGWRSYALHGWNDYFPAGTYQRTEYLNEANALAHGLRLDGSRRGHELLEQVESAQVDEIFPRYLEHPVRGQPMFLDGKIVLDDPENDVVWTFSHDRMRFFGQDARTRAPAGWLAPATQDSDPEPRFSEVPTVVGARRVLTRHRVYDLDADGRHLTLRFALSGDESFVTTLNDHGDFASVLSDRALYLFEPASSTEPFTSVPFEGDVRNLQRVLLAKSRDSYLVSFLWGRLSRRDHHEARQIVALIGRDGRSDTVVDHPLAAGPPAWERHRGFLISPFIQHLHDLSRTAIGPYRENRVTVADILEHPVPPAMAGWALLIACLSAAITARSAHRRRLGKQQRWAWTAAAFLTGLPGFVSFLFLTRTPQ